GGGANEAQGSAIGQQPTEGVVTLLDEGGNIFDQQRQGDVKGINSSQSSRFQAQRLQQLRQQEHDQDLLPDEQGLATPPVMQPQLLFEGQDGQFDIPATRIEARNIAQGELAGIKHISQIAAHLRAIAKAHQAQQTARSWAMGRTPPHADMQNFPPAIK